MSLRLQPILDRLAKGETIENHKESGNSMTPIISHREPFTLSPVDTSKVDIGDVVLAKVKGRFYTHKIVAVKNDQVQIGNNHGGTNGWTTRSNVFGIVSAVSGRIISSALEKIIVAEGKNDKNER